MGKPAIPYPTTPDGKPKYTTSLGDPLHYPSTKLPGLGSGQILPDWLHRLWDKRLKRDTSSQQPD